MENTKICSKCGRELPLSEFYKCKGHKDGLQNYCKECFKKQNKQFRTDNPEYYKEYHKEYHKEYYKEYYKEFQKEYNKTPFGRAIYLANRHKSADAEHGRENDINGKWILNNIFPSKCIYCGESDWHKLGCDRIDNEIGHIPSNIVCACEECNRERGRKSFEDFYLFKRGVKYCL